MSSTLFGRGINTQTGGSRRAMQVDRDVELLKQNVATLSLGLSVISELRQTISELRQSNTELVAKVAGLQRANTEFERIREIVLDLIQKISHFDTILQTNTELASLQESRETVNTEIARLREANTEMAAKIARLEATVSLQASNSLSEPSSTKPRNAGK